MKNKSGKSSEEKDGAASKPISLAPLSTTEALRGLLAVKPIKGEQVKKASKKRMKKRAAKK